MIECPHCRRPTMASATYPTIRGVRCEKCGLLEFVRYLVDSFVPDVLKK